MGWHAAACGGVPAQAELAGWRTPPVNPDEEFEWRKPLKLLIPERLPSWYTLQEYLCERELWGYLAPPDTPTTLPEPLHMHMYEHYRYKTIPAGLLVAMAMFFLAMVLEQTGIPFVEAILTTLCVLVPAMLLLTTMAVKILHNQAPIEHPLVQSIVQWSGRFWRWFAGDANHRPGYDWLILLLVLWPVVLYSITWLLSVAGWPDQTAYQAAHHFAAAMGIGLLLVSRWKGRNRPQRSL
jgi:hypothetical protein